MSMILSLSNGKNVANGKNGTIEKPMENSVYEPAKQMQSVEQNVLAKDAILTGSIQFVGELLVEGAVDGKIISETGDVIIGSMSSVTADIESANVSIEGEVRGNLKVKEKCLLSEGSVLIGDLISSSVELESGAIFWGKSQVGNAPKKDKLPKRA